MGRSSFWPWVLAAGAVVLGVLAWVLDALAGSHGEPWWQTALAGVVVLASIGVGLLVVVRRRGHPIGWLLLANAFVLASIGFAQAYAAYAIEERPDALPGAAWAVLWDQSSWPLLFAILIAIAFVFPDGRLPSPRWRRVATAAAVSFAAFLVLSFFDAEPFEAPYERVDRPLPALPDALGALWPLAFLGVVASLLAGAQAVRMRFRRARGIERLQLKWVAYTALLVPATLLVCLGGRCSPAASSRRTSSTLSSFSCSEPSPPRSASRFSATASTTSTGSSTARSSTACSPSCLPPPTAPPLCCWAPRSAAARPGQPRWRRYWWRSPSGPCARRVQDAVDRRFSRARYDARHQIAAFLEDLRAGRAEPEAIEPVLREVLSDPRLELRFFLPKSQLYVDARGHPRSDHEEDDRLCTPVARAGLPLGLVLHDPIDEERPGLLEEVVEAAGLAIEIARLHVELRRQLDEVEASRARIVSAGYEERRRLERDLHDGAQQRLITIGLALRHAQHELGVSPDKVSASIDGAVTGIEVAIEELQELARGVRPAQLDEGLTPALRELAARASLPVEVKASGERFPQELEAAAYFIASEGLTNAVKHASAGQVTLSAEHLNGSLVITVTDDGVGGASAYRGSGLRGLSDRAEAHRGTLAVESEPGGGTTLTAELPCE